MKFEVMTKKDYMDNVLIALSEITGIPSSDVRNLSMMGYLTHMLGDIYEQSVYDSLTLNREAFVVTAQSITSMYKYASISGLTDLFAEPAYLDAVILISADEIKEKGVYNNTTQTYVLNIKDFAINKDENIVFRCPYDITFTMRDISTINSTNKRYIVGAKYDKSVFNPLGDKYIKRTDLKVSRYGVDSYMVKVRAYEFDIAVKEHRFLNGDFTSDKVISIPFKGQFVTVYVEYRQTRTSQWETLEEKLLFDLSKPKSQDVFYYHLVGRNKINIVFKSGVFLPIIGSDIRVSVMTCHGSKASRENFDDAAAYEAKNLVGDRLNIKVITEVSVGGKDTPTIDELRDIVIKNNRTRDSILSATDLEEHFNSGSDIEYTLVKRNHTNIKMNYEIYGKMLIDGMTVPSLTSNLLIDTSTDWQVTSPDGKGHMLMDLPVLKPYGGPPVSVVGAQHKEGLILEVDNSYNGTNKWFNVNHRRIPTSSTDIIMTTPYFLYYIENYHKTGINRAVLYDNAPNLLEQMRNSYTYEGSTEPIIITSCEIKRNVKESNLFIDLNVVQGYTANTQATDIYRKVDITGKTTTAQINSTIERYDGTIAPQKPIILEFTTSIVNGRITARVAVDDVDNVLDNVYVELYDDKDLDTSVNNIEDSMNITKPVEVLNFIGAVSTGVTVTFANTNDGIYYARLVLSSGGVIMDGMTMVDYPNGLRIGGRPPQVVTYIVDREPHGTPDVGYIKVMVGLDDQDGTTRHVTVELLERGGGKLAHESIVGTGNNIYQHIFSGISMEGYYKVKATITNAAGRDIVYISDNDVWLGDQSKNPTAPSTSSGSMISGPDYGSAIGTGLSYTTTAPTRTPSPKNNSPVSLVDTNRIKIVVNIGEVYIDAVMMSYDPINMIFKFRATMPIESMYMEPDNIVKINSDFRGSVSVKSFNCDDDIISAYVYSKEDVPAGLLPIVHPDTNVGAPYHLSSIYKTESVKVFRSYYDDIKIHPLDAGNGKMLFTDVPVIGYNFEFEDKYRDKINESIRAEATRIGNLYMVTEQNYDINYLFTNTVGKSKYVFTGTFSQRVPLPLNISISVSVRVSRVTKLTRADIIIWIVDYFEAIKFKDGETFHSSKMIRAIKDKYPDILEIEFDHICNLDPHTYQRIFMVLPKNDYMAEEPSIRTYINKNGEAEYDVTVNYM